MIDRPADPQPGGTASDTGGMAGQSSSADLAKAAEEFGITFVHFPVEPGSINAEVADAFIQACDALERPLMICGRSGGQSTKIWETAEAFLD